MGLSRPAQPRRLIPRPRSAFEGPSWVDRWILPFVREPTLWPVLLVVIGHAVAFIAPMLLLAFRDGHGAAMGALLAVGFATVSGVYFDLRRGRPAALSGLFLSIWLLSGAAAYAADRAGLF